MKRSVSMLIVAGLIAAFGIFYAASGEVRAEVNQLIRQVAGFLVEERAQSPLHEFEETASSPVQDTTSQAEQIVPTPVELEIPALLASEVIQNAPFDFSLPQYAPEGFTLQDDAAIANSQTWVLLTWSNAQHAEITMLVEETYTGYALPVGADSTEETEVNGQSAMLVKGGWNSDHVWQADYGMELHWQVGGHYYRLIWTQRSAEHNELSAINEDLDTVKSELIHMAESVE